MRQSRQRNANRSGGSPTVAKWLWQDSVRRFLVLYTGRAFDEGGSFLGSQHHGLQRCDPFHEPLPPFRQ
jgi:hypothetical protein